MENRNGISRRGFMQLGLGLGAFAALGRLNIARAATATDYKALVCIFLFGGNDGHNTVVPLDSTGYNNYKAGRLGLALPPGQLLPINTSNNAPYGLHYGLPELQSLYNQNKLAILANAGMLVQPTSRQQFLSPNATVPTNLFSHADQVVQMQTGAPNASSGAGWGGRTADFMQPLNTSANFPTSISLSGQALFCSGKAVQSASLQPGNYMAQNAMSFWPQAEADKRAQSQKEIVTTTSGNQMIDAANKQMGDALTLGPMLKNASGSSSFANLFPPTPLGDQLKEVANIINLRQQLGVSRQVFFCSLGGFDLHSGLSWNHWNLLTQVSKAMSAFYTATGMMQIQDSVTTFTLSDFGRTLQPGGTGSDHGWGSHYFIMGGAVKGGDLYGTFPQLILNGPDDANTRGVLIPTVSISQYGATLARWFGAAEDEIDQVFPTLANFNPVRDLGFMQ
ncbi:MAG: hypothetical protein QOH63_342 [Acidobacteriota bacterium]|jgi:uncharacterized protein (DUF1501 family)|nr:hypothetical protein [Acidobacteriota bacterium]